MLSKDQRETDQTQKRRKGYAKPLCFDSELEQTIQCHYTGKWNNTSVELILNFHICWLKTGQQDLWFFLVPPSEHCQSVHAEWSLLGIKFGGKFQNAVISSGQNCLQIISLIWLRATLNSLIMISVLSSLWNSSSPSVWTRKHTHKCTHMQCALWGCLPVQSGRTTVCAVLKWYKAELPRNFIPRPKFVWRHFAMSFPAPP